jgi:hypothetical protein
LSTCRFRFLESCETALVVKAKEPANPFYVLVIILGVVFLITACAYATMTYRAIVPGAPRDGGTHALMEFLDRYGMQLMAGQLVALAAATFGAMWLDRFRALGGQRDQTQPDGRETDPGSNPKIR